MAFYDPSERARLTKIRTEQTGQLAMPHMGKMPTRDTYAVYDDGSTVVADNNKTVRVVRPEYQPKNTDDIFFLPGNEEDLSNLSQFAQDNMKPVANMDIPTSSSNVGRPRTLAAGYYLYVGERAKAYADQKGKLTVMFRDGTLYNYYDVPPGVWVQFRNSISKGPMLNRANRNQGSDGILLNFPNGPADLSDVPKEMQAFMYKASRDAQVRTQVQRARNVQVGEREVRTGRERFDPTKPKRGAQYGYVPKSASRQVQYSKGSITSRTVMGKNPNQK